MKKKQIYVLCVLLIGIILSLYITIQFISHPPTQSYIVSVSGSNYQVLNEATNAVLYQSTSSSAAINYLLGATGVASSGNTIYVKAGTYTVDKSWLISVSGVNIAFQPGATLQAVNSLNNPVLNINANNVNVFGGTIDGNGPNQALGGTGPQGILISGSNVLVSGATIQNVRQFGYTCGGTNNGIIDSTVQYCGWNGINLGTTMNKSSTDYNNYAVNNVVSACSDVGITNCGYNNIVTGNTVTIDGIYIGGFAGPGSGSQWAIGVEGGGGSGNGDYLLIANNKVISPNAGICIAGFSYILVAGNSVSGAYNGVVDNPNGAHNTIKFNSFSNCNTGIFVMSGVTGDTVYGNTFSGNDNNFSDSGSGTSTSQPSIEAVTVTSTPAGSGFITANGSAGYAGSYSTNPYMFYAEVRRQATQTHTITISASDTTYTLN